jgi:MarR family transcriptional regulator, organic hydroperoxide resistance regulator
MAASRTRSARPRFPEATVLEIDPATSVELDGALQFMRALWVTVHALQMTSKWMAIQFGVTGPQRLVIRVVGLAPGISAGGLAKVLHLHPSTLTGVLKRLEAQGLLDRSPDASDGRRAVLRLTAQGQRLNVPAEGTVEAAVRATLAHMPASDQRIIRDALELLAEHLSAQPSRTRSRRPRPRPRTA